MSIFLSCFMGLVLHTYFISLSVICINISVKFEIMPQSKCRDFQKENVLKLTV